jgi:hypothetical protein
VIVEQNENNAAASDAIDLKRRKLNKLLKRKRKKKKKRYIHIKRSDKDR